MTTEQRSAPASLAATWLLVLLPTLWGLSYTVRNALKLFTPQPAATAPITPSSSSAPSNAPR